jgi:cytochrome c-type biogenesis protein CcmH/NrfG
VSRGAESGFVATEFAFGVAVLLLPIALLVLTFPRWSERQVTARVIAREVARRTARDGVCELSAARALGATMARNLGVAPGEIGVDLVCADGVALAPGSDVEARVTVAMPAVQLPGAGAVGAWSWTARHREPVDRYASAR